ncbi:MAG TPA: glycoside hydrolase family protein [Candidatus Anaerofilum excrementigallinarum]|nr:glycoside hydrolase family protein [Candidatus Anaerofilum excrementigallinarum]
MNRLEKLSQEMLLPAPVGGGFSMEGYWVWCGSVIQGEDGRYHMFASRWPKTLPFHPGWGVASEIVRADSDTPEGPYTFREVVLPARGAGWWDGRVTHNPSICRVGDKYVLFYVGTTYPFPDVPADGSLCHDSLPWLAARANKRIGAAVSDSVFGPWKRMDHPLLDVRPGHFDDFLTSNPAPCIGEDGSCLLVYKTRTWRKPPYNNCTGNEMFSDMKLGVAFAPRWDGPYQRLETPLFEGQPGILEDPFVWKTDKGYAMIAKDWNGAYTGEVGRIMNARSADGIHWEADPDATIPLDILWSDGKVRRVGNLDRPFILFDRQGRATHLFCATNDGQEAGFATMTRSWNMCIPLRGQD